MSATTTGAKSKFFGFLKGLFQRTDTGSAPEEAVGESSPTPATAKTTARSARNGNGNGGAHASHRGAASVSISMSAILSGLPADLKSKVKHPNVGDLAISVALDKILSQLSHGAVKISFGDIRQAAPQIFTTGAESDRITVSLPLNEILTQLNPALLVRRPAQKQVEVPSEITSPFDTKGPGLVFSVGNAKPVTPAAPRQAVPAPVMPARGAISSVPTPSAPPAAAPIPKSKAITPVPPAIPATPAITFTPITPKSPAAPTPPAKQAAPTPPAKPAAHPAVLTPIVPVAMAQTSSAPGLFQPAPSKTVPPSQPVQLKPVPPFQPAPSKPGTAPQPAQPAANVELLAVPLKVLVESWPEQLKAEIVRSKLLDAQVMLPSDAIENALKTGRAAFSWKALRSWIQPAPVLNDSPNDEMELDLPLKVVTPLFFTRKNTGMKSTQRVTIDEAIPNLFFGFPGAEPAPVPTPGISESPVAKAGPVTKPVDTNYYVWDDDSDTVPDQEVEYRRKTPGGTDFVARYATPNEIVSRAAALDGVAGALIALPDGLMVASRIPSELNGDTLAAFLPQIFAKVNQCTRELRMGELNNLNFTVGNVPWKIFRVNAIFFAAFGRVAEPLPTAGLAALAAELDRKQK